MLANKKLYLTLDLDICIFRNEELTEDERSLFIQYSYLVINNLIYLNLNAYYKVRYFLKNLN